MYSILVIIYLVYLVALTIVLGILWGLTKLIYRKFKLNKWYLICVGVLYILPFIYYLYTTSAIGQTSWLENKIEWASKVDFPKFVITECEEGERAFQGDFTDKYKVRFISTPSDEFYNEIEALCKKKFTSEEDDPSWRKKDSSHYQYYRIWGGIYPDPDGNYNHNDEFLEINIEKGAREFTVTYGQW